MGQITLFPKFWSDKKVNICPVPFNTGSQSILLGWGVWTLPKTFVWHLHLLHHFHMRHQLLHRGNITSFKKISMINAHGVGVYLCNPRPPMCRPPDCERKRKRLLGSQRCPSIGLKVLFICQELIKFERRTLDSKTRSVGYLSFFSNLIPGIDPAPAKRLIRSS